MNLYQGFGNNQSYYQPQRTNTIIPPSQQQQPAFIGLKGRPVSSLEEARAAAIDFDGSVFFFPDLANKRIYTKQINLDGTASMNMYEYKEVPTEAFNSSNFVTRQEFDETLNDIIAFRQIITESNARFRCFTTIENVKIPLNDISCVGVLLIDGF